MKQDMTIPIDGYFYGEGIPKRGYVLLYAEHISEGDHDGDAVGSSENVFLVGSEYVVQSVVEAAFQNE